MDESQLRSLLGQALKNFQSCGLTRIPCNEELDSGILRSIEDWRTSQQLASSDTRSDFADSSFPSNPTKAHVKSPNLVVENTVAESQESPLPENDFNERVGVRSWQLPNLGDSERKKSFEELETTIRACRLCTEICRHRQQTVFGAGPLRPKVCFMGEAPGADEDRVGLPFVGKAGQLLSRIITAMQLRREDVYILNALKCRPPNNRTPTDQEISNCRSFVESQLATLQPEYIVCLGAVAVRSLLGDTTSIGRLRGRFFEYHGSKVVVTYHPAYLLRNEDAKRLVWEDMQLLMRAMGIPIPGKT